MVISLLHNSVAFMAPHDAHCISSAMQIKMTDSVAEYQSMPKELMCPNTKQNCMMSYSIIKATSNGVPSLCVTINMHIHALRVGSSVGTGSLPEAVAVDEVDILNNFLRVMA